MLHASLSKLQTVDTNKRRMKCKIQDRWREGNYICRAGRERARLYEGTSRQAVPVGRSRDSLTNCIRAVRKNSARRDVLCI